MWQNVIVGLIVLLAAVYVFRRLARNFRSRNKSGGCGCGCGSQAGPQPQPLIMDEKNLKKP